jgi:hypothetical protein
VSSIVTALTGGGGAGMAFKPTAAPIMSGVNEQQAQDQYGNVQQGLLNQQNLVDALKAQHGLQNQTNTFNQLQGVANGEGPNPAQAMLNNQTGQNIAAQNALMAGQRGTSANTGLLARQAAMQGANIQQQAAGQGAAMQANQSMNALNQMSGLSTNQANQLNNAQQAYNNAALQGQQNVLGGVNNLNQANVGMQSNMNNVSGGLAGHVAGQQGNMMGNMMGGIGSAMNLFKGGGGAGGMMGSIGGASDGATMAGGAGDIGGASGMLDAGEMLAANGGMVPKLKKYAEGGMTELQSVQQPMQSNGPQSIFGKSQEDKEPDVYKQAAVATMPITGQAAPQPDMMGQLGDIQNTVHNQITGDNASSKRADGSSAGIQFDFGDAGKGGAKGASFGSHFGPWGTAIGGLAGALGGGFTYEAEGGKVPALVSPGEKYLDPQDVRKVQQGADPLKVGETIPGKPKVGGAKNSYANDIVPKTLESGGIVLPRSVTQHEDAPRKAAEFVAAILRRGK